MDVRGLTDRARRWAGTMEGHADAAHRSGLTVAHVGGVVEVGPVTPFTREQREQADDLLLAPGASRAVGAGRRAHPEEPDAMRTCFERDRDRILHAPAFRRL